MTHAEAGGGRPAKKTALAAKRPAAKTTEEKVLGAALREFAQRGFDGARVDSIAKRAKVNKAMIYYHFKSKEALYEAILNEIALKIYEFFGTHAAGGTLDVDGLYALVREYVQFLGTLDRDYIRMMLREISSGGKYFRKVILPKLIAPVLMTVASGIESEKKKGRLRGINPYYTMFQIVGSILFFNMMQIALNGSDTYDMVFAGDFNRDFQDNLVGILREGIEKQKGG